MKSFIPCIEKTVDDIMQAAAVAVTHNPANAPARMAALMQPENPQFIAVMTTKYWGQKGKDFSVSFLDNPTQACRNKILAHMNAWNERCNVSFRESSQGDIRIARQSGSGYWSYLGTDITLVPPNEPTMNLEAFTEKTADSEYKRVVRHETGHTLGCPHEHLRKEIIDMLDYQKTLAYFRRTQGWNQQTVIANVLTPLEETSILGSPTTDQDSIMCYSLPAGITKSGKVIVGGTDITQNDYQWMSKLYPKGDVAIPMDNVNVPINLNVLIKVLSDLGYSVKKG